MLALGERFKYRTVSRLAIAPNGSKLCVQFSAHDATLGAVRHRLMLVDANTGKNRWLTAGSEGDVQPVFWPDGRRVLFLSRRKLPGKEWNACPRALWHIPLDGGEAEPLRVHETDIQNFTISADGRRIAFLARDKNRQSATASAAFESTVWLKSQAAPLRCFIFDVASRLLHRVRTGPAAHVTSAALSPDGMRLALAVQPSAMPNDGWKGRLLLAELPKMEATKTGQENSSQRSAARQKRMTVIRPVPVTPPLGVRAVVWAPDGQAIAFSSIGPSGDWLKTGAVGLIHPPANLRTLSPARLRALVPRFLGVNLDEHLELGDFLPGGKHLLVLGPTPFGRGLARLEVATGQGAWVSKPHGVYKHVCVASRSGDVAYLHETDALAPSVYVSRAGSKQTVRVLVGDRAQEAAGGYKVEFVQASAPDGTRTEAMISWGKMVAVEKIKNQKSKIKNLLQPLIVVLHGGPMGAFANLYGPVLDPTALFPLRELLDQGVAVGWINPRGSTGYGSGLRSANVAKIGDADADDILAHVGQWLKTGKIDPKRVALIGWSYGGFLAGCVAAKVSAWSKEIAALHFPTGFQFQTVVVGAAPSDFFGMYGNCDVHGTLHRWIGGEPMASPALWDRLTAPRMLQNWNTPTLILHGINDTRVPVEQGKLLYRMLRAKRVPVRLHVLPGAGHIPGDARNLMAIHRLTWEWLVRYLRWPAKVLSKEEVKNG